MRIADADGPTELRWKCVGGPPGWSGTEDAWGVEKTDAGAVIRLDRRGFAAVDDLFRIVTVGCLQILLSLKAYLETGERKPFFDF